MNVKELRIGNYVESPRGIEEIKYAESLEEIEGSPDKFKGIPITEQWLLKFGIDTEYEISIKARRKKIAFTWGSRIVRTGERFGWSCNKYPHIKHVHQLQNLYFALSGKELTIKE